MSARAEQAGNKHQCSVCGAKVQVPALPPQSTAGSVPAPPLSPVSVRAPQPTLVEPEPVPVPLPAAEQESFEAPLASSTAMALSHEPPEEPPGAPEVRSRRQARRPGRNYLNWMFPVACLGLLTAIGSILLRKPPDKFEGRITGERLTDSELGPFRIEGKRLGRSKAELEPVIDSLESSPLRAKTASLTVDFKGVDGRLEISMRTTDRAELYRVDPNKDKRIAGFIDDQKRKYRAAVNETLDEAVPKFLRAVEGRTDRDRDVHGLAEFRDSVALAAAMRGTGFGYFVQAAVGKQAYPCVMEDTEGRLFFALPAGTEEFDLVGRERTSASNRSVPRFNGRFTVVISDRVITINKESPDGNEKVRKALGQ
jgi:hypothetical protein